MSSPPPGQPVQGLLDRAHAAVTRENAMAGELAGIVASPVADAAETGQRCSRRLARPATMRNDQRSCVSANSQGGHACSTVAQTAEFSDRPAGEARDEPLGPREPAACPLA